MVRGTRTTALSQGSCHTNLFKVTWFRWFHIRTTATKIGGQYLNKLEYASGIHLHVPHSNAKANDYGSYIGSMSNHDKVYDNVIGVLHNDAEVVANCNEALKTVEIIEKMYAAYGGESAT